eukprot:XP_011617896.1 PREDICTED: LOW QUALITY PROTEIN: ecto-NOX disulfide-thiol exchanger 1-like [Takifugu rubripes]
MASGPADGLTRVMRSVSCVAAADGAGGVSAEQNHLNVGEHGAWATAMNNMGILPVGISGQQLLPDSLCIQRFDPSLGLITPLSPMMAGINLVPPPPGPPDGPVIKEIIHCKSCTLFPQNPNLPPPSTRERPPGCKTVFVGGLPENATEEVIREVFEQCGEIAALRKSKKNFCHIRFSEEFMVDKHVDFAQARDDLYEWECKQRLLAREERHRRKIQEDQLRPPSPPPTVHYSEHEAALLAERLRGGGAGTGHSGRFLFLCEPAHFMRSQTEQEKFRTYQELRSAYSEEVMGIRREEEMEMSEDDCEESPCKRMRAGVYEQSLKEENDSLRWQLDSYRNEVELLRKDQVRNSRADDERVLSQTNGPDVQIQLLQQSLHSVQQQLLSLQDRLRSKEAELEQAKEEHRWLEGQMVALQQRLLRTNVEAVEGPITELHLQEANGGVLSLNPSRERSSGAIVQGGVASEKEAVLLGIMSTFLHVHPFGANLEYLWSYIQRLDSQVSAADLERLMVRLPTMFRQELSGVGANLEKRWTFCGFDSLSSA